jgi:hypothetical protein
LVIFGVPLYIAVGLFSLFVILVSESLNKGASIRATPIEFLQFPHSYFTLLGWILLVICLHRRHLRPDVGIESADPICLGSRRMTRRCLFAQVNIIAIYMKQSSLPVDSVSRIGLLDVKATSLKRGYVLLCNGGTMQGTP